ncbi:hypothetical protein CCAX7_34440 [Capsulimonas corticalis]|uniref:Uncharacterized protein n=1 Tax=Capsulimonas corticalis TaxID=2219043 RepID=A0A402CYB6_9BACT|nr:DUF5700 domain-containing putative Zn-dependent protease [Capsulimonas corticalis]BDI31393.1 hypothetical protein CCAX7_34440 [Capsulimonas corticalis]
MIRPAKRGMGALLGAVLVFLSAGAYAADTKVKADAEPKVQITVDDSAVRQLIALAAAHDTTDASLDAWMDLPANAYLLKIGASEENLTRAQLKANAIEAINGTATPKTQPSDDMGAMRFTAEIYTKMLDTLQASLPNRLKRITDRDKQFSPPNTDVTETVYLHLGGDWDAINANGAIYINIRYWIEQAQPSWNGFNMVVAHETMHTIQNQAYGNPEDQADGPGAFLTALSKTQREGTARYVEYDTDPEAYGQGTYGFFSRAVTTETLRSFPTDINLLKPLYDSCFPAFSHDKFVQSYASGVSGGGPFYDVGHGIAKAIDERLGRKVLIDTIAGGPKMFFTKYLELCDKDKNLPKLPDDVAKQVRVMPDKL